jgi:hypothetical protein
MFGRYDIHRRIQQLDPKDDCQQIVYLVGAYEYPWLIRKSLEFGLFRTYAAPRMTKILQATGQFAQHGQKRYDDTTLLLAGIAQHGYDSDYGRMAIARMNQMHSRWHIHNEDMLYVLSTFIYEPRRWHEKYGWRKPTRIGNLANYHFWCEVGRRMGIKDIPATYEAYEAFNRRYEREMFAYAASNELIGRKTLEVFKSWYPAPLRPLVEEVALSFMDDRLLNAFGFKKPHSIIRWTAHIGLKLLAFVLRFMPPRKEPYHFVDLPTRTYPDGFEVAELGVHYDDETSPTDEVVPSVNGHGTAR